MAGPTRIREDCAVDHWEAAMTIDVDAATASDPSTEHDHAWRKLPGVGDDKLVGEYRCDLCLAVWSL